MTMDELISPKYQMELIEKIEKAIWEKYVSYKKVNFYIEKWHIVENDDYNNYWENFQIIKKENGEIDLLSTLNAIDGDTLIKIAIDLGIDTPDFIPSIPTFRNVMKSDYKTVYDTLQKAFKQIEEDPDTAIGLANSALEGIIKEILKDKRVNSNIKGNETLYNLAAKILKFFKLYPNSDAPEEIKVIGSSLLNICQKIEKLRSEKTTFHGKTKEDYVIEDSLYAYFIVNSVSTVGLFLITYYRTKFPKAKPDVKEIDEDDLPF